MSRFAGRPIRILIVEDCDDDAFLIAHELRRNGNAIEYERVETATELGAALETGHWDAVISDYRMPRFGGLAALAQVRAWSDHLPFILVSATVEKDVAESALRTGANDCIMKQNLRQLLPAVLRQFP